MANKYIVIIPTYNERGNVRALCERIVALNLPTDILFIDDNSPDGTGSEIDALEKEYEPVFVIHRKGKMGVGSAHLDGIRRAYASGGYTHIITMDCDFTHSPEEIPSLIFYADDRWSYDVIVGNRHIFKSSLNGWSAWRKFVTHVGHLLTTILLEMPHDATGAFRVYNISRIPERLFDLVTSKDYSFFFESLLILKANGFRIQDVVVTLSPRSCGSSKLKTGDLITALTFMLKLKYDLHFNRDKLLLA